MTITRYQRAITLPLAGITALSLAACSSTSSTTTAAASPTTAMSSMPMSTSSSMTASPSMSASRADAAVHNDADVAFATGMIPHHEQAVTMAKLAATRASSTAVKDLATKIEAAQQPEITMMSGWLTTWGKPVPSPMGGMDMGGNTGMMSAADMTSLTNSKGAAFDKMFLTMMITHHQGALTMAATETTSGKNVGALALAKSITTSQTAEIATMRNLLSKV